MSLLKRLKILENNNYIPIIGNGIKTNTIAKNADAGWPLGIDQLSNSNLIIADYTFNLIWEINKSGKLNVIAGTGMQGYSGDNELAINAELNGPHDLVVDDNDNIYFSDLGNQVYRMIDYKTKIITTIAGNGMLGRKGDGELAINAEMDCYCGIAISEEGDIYISSEWSNNIRKIDKKSGVISLFAGYLSKHNSTNVNQYKPIVAEKLSLGGYSGDGGPKEIAAFNHPEHLAFDSNQDLYICDNSNDRIRKIDMKTGIVSTIFGNGDKASNGDGGLAVNASTLMPDALCIDDKDNIYVGEKYGFRIRKIDSETGIVSTVAGNGNPGYGGENVLATETECNSIEVGLHIRDNNILYSDCSGRVRQIDSKGYVSTIFGGTSIHDKEDSLNAFLASPFGISISNNGDIYIADTWNQRIRKINSSDNTIETIAGTGARAYGGDGGLATNAHLGNPYGVSVNSKNEVYISDTRHSHIRRIDLNGIIHNVAGSAFSWDKGDGGPSISSNIVHSRSIIHDSNDNIYFGDSGIGKIRKIDFKTGIINTYAGIGISGYSGDNKLAVNCKLVSPVDLAFDNLGNLYFADEGAHVIRKIDNKTGIITTVAGNGDKGFSKDGTKAIDSYLDSPSGIDVSENGTIYFSDTNNKLIRKINEEGKIESIFGINTRKSKFEDRYDTNQYNKMILPRNLKFYNKKILLVSDHFNHQILAISIK